MRASAHGKVILFGEHAVVYGIPALAVGIDRGARAEARPASGPNGVSSLRVRGWDVTILDQCELHASSSDAGVTGRSDENTPAPNAVGSGVHDPRPLIRAFRDVIAVTRREQVAAGQEPVGAVFVDAESDLPPGAGVGCSAALGVAVARALDPLAEPHVIARRVHAWESVFHGNPSGIDAAVSAIGGCIWYRRGQGAPSVEQPSQVSSDAPSHRDGIVESQGDDKARAAHLEPVRLRKELVLCIGHSGRASSTKTMVQAVAHLRERRPEMAEQTFAAIETLVKNARLALEAHDLVAVGQLLDLNQMLLAGLLLSTPEIEQLCGSARASGALGAKLTGAGGGGCVVALVDSEATGHAVVEAWKREGFDGFLTTVRPPGPRSLASETSRERLSVDSARSDDGDVRAESEQHSYAARAEAS